MQAKALELRDRGTFIALLAVNMNPDASVYDPDADSKNEGQTYLLRRVGYPCDGKPNIMVTYLGGGYRADNDPYGWKNGARTFPVAHQWIIDNWPTIKDGDVIDVEFILGETTEPKKSERIAP